MANEQRIPWSDRIDTILHMNTDFILKSLHICFYKPVCRKGKLLEHRNTERILYPTAWKPGFRMFAYTI